MYILLVQKINRLSHPRLLFMLMADITKIETKLCFPFIDNNILIKDKIYIYIYKFTTTFKSIIYNIQKNVIYLSTYFSLYFVELPLN